MSQPSFDPMKPPPPEELSELTDAEVYETIRWWAEKNYAAVGMQFWIDELAHRRMERQLAALNTITERMEQATADAVQQSATMLRLTQITTILTGVSVIVAIVALMIAATVD